jgi:signal transduction histidine kinase/CheY-like chemotaxis protein
MRPAESTTGNRNSDRRAPHGLPLRIAGIVFWGLVVIGLVVTGVLMSGYEKGLSAQYTERAALLAARLENLMSATKTRDFEVHRAAIEGMIRDLDILGLEMQSADQLLAVGETFDGDAAAATIVATKFPNVLETPALRDTNLTLYFPNFETVVTQHRKHVLLGMGGLFLAFGILLQMALRRVLKAPFDQMTGAAKQFLAGRRDVRFDEKRGDEFGFLAGFVNQVLDQLNHEQSELRHALERERDAENRNEELRAATRAKSAFLANMSHEIRTPLNAIIGYTEIMLRDPAIRATHERPLRCVERAGAHLLELIDGILDLSRIEAGAMEVNEVDFDVHELIDGIGDLFRLRCADKGIAWKLRDNVASRNFVRSDQYKIRQVLVNLIGNAVKFTNAGEVVLSVSNEADRYTFEIRDTGIGIAADEQARLFRPFAQGAAGIKKGGTGLGLAITRRNLEMLGSELALESTPGAGTTFRFTLRLPAATRAVAARARRRSDEVRLAPGTAVDALVTDDVEENRELLAYFLRGIGVSVRMAENGQDALDKIAARRPDIVFMDVRMPVMDGVEALRRIRAGQAVPHLPCVAITASAMAHEVEHYLAQGFDRLLGKPFRLDAIQACLVELLNVRLVPARAAPTGTGPAAVDLAAVVVPETIYTGLRDAAEIGAITRIEQLIAEVRASGQTAAGLAALLEERLAQYDTDGISKLLERVAHG